MKSQKKILNNGRNVVFLIREVLVKGIVNKTRIAAPIAIIPPALIYTSTNQRAGRSYSSTERDTLASLRAAPIYSIKICL